MKLLKNSLLFIFLIQSFTTTGQDSLRTLSSKQVTDIVKAYHPVARQADILVDKAKADVTIARGLFDPVLSAKVSGKTFDGTDYYTHSQPALSIPAWYGIEFNAGIENLSGNRTDPQETIGRTSFAGITIPLAKNLLMDKRRAALQQSKITREMSEVQKQSAINDLLLDALHAYWNWVQQYQFMLIAGNAVTVNEKRFELVKTAWRQGDRPAIDTTEALAQLQSFRYLYNDAMLRFQNAGLELSVYLWRDNNKPYQLPADVVPDTQLLRTGIDVASLPVFDELITTTASRHPDLLQYNYKIDVLQVEKKLKFQELLPVFNFRYNQLGKGYNLPKTVTASLFENNYQYGITLGIPLRLSQGRGEYRKAKLKIQETKLEQTQKQVTVINKVKAYYNELAVLKKQVALQQQQYSNYLTLQKGEETRFFNGESSLFLINARENKVLEVQQKLAELETKFFKTLSSLQWAAGILYNK